MPRHLSGLDEDEYARFRDHPIRDLMQRAAGGDHVHADTLDRLALPKTIRKALEEALERVTPDRATGKRAPRMGAGSPDVLASEIFSALYNADPHWETPTERRQRQAQEGDPDALASLKAEREATDDLVDRIMDKTR